MNEADIRNRYIQDIPAFRAWGLFVQSHIINSLKKSLDVNIFLKIPPQEPRIKSIDSLLAKAFHRKKEYASPYSDITDKVGVRFVVLLTSDIPRISNIIDSQNNVLWRSSKDKDYEDQRRDSPEHFTYESVHYVVYSLDETTYEGVTIPSGIPCEIQIRTLLQHAYAEMSHDTVYKPQVVADPQVKRCMARSMALVESADYFFIEAMEEISKKSQLHQEWTDLCLEFYPTEHTTGLDSNANTYLIDQLIPLLKDITIHDVRLYLQRNKIVFDKLIGRKVELSWIYRQPAVLLTYYLIHYKNTTLQRNWPLTDDLLHPLLSDMGVAALQY